MLQAHTSSRSFAANAKRHLGKPQMSTRRLGNGEAGDREMPRLRGRHVRQSALSLLRLLVDILAPAYGN